MGATNVHVPVSFVYHDNDMSACKKSICNFCAVKNITRFEILYTLQVHFKALHNHTV